MAEKRRARESFTKRGGYEAGKPLSQIKPPKNTGSTGAGASAKPKSAKKS